MTWVVQWVQAGRGRRARRRIRSDQLAEFEASVQARWAAAAEAAADYPTLSGIVDAATEATEIWARRPVHGDAYVISLGTGDEPWEPPVTRSAGVIDPEVAAVIERFSHLPGVASTMDLSAAGAIGVVRRSDRGTIARPVDDRPAGCHDGPGGLGTARRDSARSIR